MKVIIITIRKIKKLILLSTTKNTNVYVCSYFVNYVSVVYGARCSSVVRVFAHGAMGRRVDPSWGGAIELFLVPASAPRLV